MQKLLTVQQARGILNLSGPTIYRLVDAKILPAVIIARRRTKKIIRFRPEALERFIAERESV